MATINLESVNADDAEHPEVVTNPAQVKPRNPDEFVFLDNEVLDSLVSTVLELSAELWVVKRRALITERLLESKGSVTRVEIETFVASAEDEAEWKAQRDRFVKRIYAPFARKLPTQPAVKPDTFFRKPS